MAQAYEPRDLQFLINRAIVASRWAELRHESFCQIDAMQDQFIESPHCQGEHPMPQYCELWHHAWSSASIAQVWLESYIGRIEHKLWETPFGDAVQDLGFADFVDGVRWARLRLQTYKAPVYNG